MVRDLRADPPPAVWARSDAPVGVSFVPLAGRPDEALAPVWAAAYPPSHVDHVPGEIPLEFLDAVLSGRAAGPVLTSSLVAMADGEPIGAVVLTCLRADGPWEGGVFVADLFRDPDPRWTGAGGALLRRALASAAADGAPRAGLSVTEGNPVRRIYDELGFRSIHVSRKTQAPLR